MNGNREKRNRLLAEKVIRGLKARNMEGFYAENGKEALELALSMISQGSIVGWGGSASIEEIGLKEAIRNGNYQVLDRDNCKDAAEKKQIERQIFSADYMLCSTNAITEDGILVNIDGNANRVAAIAYGPEHVIMIVGMNKVAKDVDAAVCRARNEAATINAQRFPLDTPCKKTGSCVNCMFMDTICCEFLITRFSGHEDRIKVILVGEDLGF